MVDNNHPPSGCANCGHSVAGRYCAHCGQDAHIDLSIGHFVGEFVEGMFHFDSTFWRTFLPLLFKPGLLTEQYLGGKRKSFAPPVRSYLVISLLYFLLASAFVTPQTRVIGPTGKEIRGQDCVALVSSVAWMRRLVPDAEGSCQRALKNEGVDFNRALNGLLPKVMFVVLPFVALVQYWLSRRQRSMYVESLIFVLHFQSFFFLASAILLLLSVGTSKVFDLVGWQSKFVGEWFSLLLYLWSAYYLFVANRLTYRTRVIKTLVSVALVAIAYAFFWEIGVGFAALYEFAHA